MIRNSIIESDAKEIADSLQDLLHNLSGKTILVTGGAGFLGRYILSFLNYINQVKLDKPCRILCVDNFITGIKSTMEENKNLVIIQHDIRKPLEVSENIDYILHAAGIASPAFYSKFPMETIAVTTYGTNNILELAKEKKVKSMVFFSSSEIYGDPDPKFIPTPETYNGNVSCTGPRACYDESKRLGETLCMTYFRQYGVPVKIVRIFNVYGPGLRVDDERVLPSFVSRALKGEDMIIRTSGSTRAFCYITDIINGIFRLLFSKYNGEPTNIGNPNEEISMLELAIKVKHLLGNKINVKEEKAEGVYGESNPKRRCPDISKAEKLLNYSPKVDLNNGLNRFVEWAKTEWI